MKTIRLSLLLLFSFFVMSCEKSSDEKRKSIVENQLENEIYQIDLLADSLKNKVNAINQQIDELEKRSDLLKDSLNKTGGGFKSPL